jgi:hypothetical protein
LTGFTGYGMKVVANCGGKHHFHEKCIEKSLKQNSQCPCCRREVTHVEVALTGKQMGVFKKVI